MSGVVSRCTSTRSDGFVRVRVCVSVSVSVSVSGCVCVSVCVYLWCGFSEKAQRLSLDFIMLAVPACFETQSLPEFVKFTKQRQALNNIIFATMERYLSSHNRNKSSREAAEASYIPPPQSESEA